MTIRTLVWTFRQCVLVGLLGGVLLGLVPPRPAGAIAVSPAIASLQSEVGDALEVSLHPATGVPRFVRPSRAGKDLAIASGKALAPQARALAFLERHRELFGLRDPAAELRLARRQREPDGAVHVSYEQRHAGVPVFGSFLRLHFAADGTLAVVNGTLVPELDLDPRPALDAAAARAAARRAGLVPVAATPARLLVWREGLLRGIPGSNHLVWAVTVTSAAGPELALIDAATAKLHDRIALATDVLDREVYFDQPTPENLIWNEGDPLPYTGSTANAATVNDIIDFTADVHRFFVAVGEYDSWDGQGSTMTSIVDSQRPERIGEMGCPNARWTMASTNYCPGMGSDDTVGHEWAHGYTQATHGLIPQWEPGALNEAYSDILGETIDLLNDQGRDEPGGRRTDGACSVFAFRDGDTSYRWLMGEDTVGATSGAFRDLWNPICHGLPSRIRDPRFTCSSADRGGTHTNMGVPSHAFALLVDGGHYNSQTITGLGLTKAVHLYWRAMRVYQGPSSDFFDHADALEQSCRDLAAAGTDLRNLVDGSPSGERITATDCEQVARAMIAVDMRAANLCATPLLDPATPPRCAQGEAVTSFRDDFEGSVGGWQRSDEGVYAEYRPRGWELVDRLPQGRSGRAFFAVDGRRIGNCQPGSDDQSGVMHLTSPPLVAPPAARLAFRHYVATEAQYDGGNVALAVGDGPFMPLPASAFRFNPYSLTLATSSSDNPLAGQSAWSGTNGNSLAGSWGESLVDLAGRVAPGETFRLRFDFGVDGCNGIEGWFVDDVEVYNCGEVETGPCVADGDTLCLHGGRYRLEVEWENQYDGRRGRGQAIPASDFAGFWAFDDPANVELMVKLLDFGDAVRVYYGQLTDLGFVLRVTDTSTGATRTYRNGPDDCGGIDPLAFPKLAPSNATAAVAAGVDGTCVADATTLCLQDGRFAVSLDWRNQYSGAAGRGGAAALSDLAGTFAFDDPRNREVLAKVLDFGDRILVAYGSLSDLEYTLLVTDTSSGATREYHNQAGRYCGGLDGDAF